MLHVPGTSAVRAISADRARRRSRCDRQQQNGATASKNLTFAGERASPPVVRCHRTCLWRAAPQEQPNHCKIVWIEGAGRPNQSLLFTRERGVGLYSGWAGCFLPFAFGAPRCVALLAIFLRLR